MASFDLSDYVQVNERIEKFYEKYGYDIKDYIYCIYDKKLEIISEIEKQSKNKLYQIN